MTWFRAWVGAAAVAFVLMPLTGSALAAPIPSRGLVLSQQDFHGLACPTTSQCTAVDSTGREWTFDPGSPSGSTVGIVDGGNSLNGVACPSATVCVGVDAAGNEVTFNPAAPGGALPVAVSAHGLNAIACRSSSRCTAVGAIPGTPVTSLAVTFDPGSPGSTTTIQIGGAFGGGPNDNLDLTMIACPSDHQCTAEGNNEEATFDPTSPGSMTAHGLPSSGIFERLACPTTSECVTIAPDSAFNTLEFDPANPASGTWLDVDPGGGPNGIACVGATDCTVVDASGQEFPLNPLAPGQPILREIGPTGFGFACPSATQCTSIGIGGDVVTFDPTSSTIPAEIRVDSEPIEALVCLSPTSCTGVDSFGGGVTFTPSSGVVTASFRVEVREGMYWLSCPSASQCTAVDDGGKETTYDPGSNQDGTNHFINNYGFRGVACPTTSRCVAVDGAGNALVFDPASPGSPTQQAVDVGQVPGAIACPTATQCTVVDGEGGAVTFNPAAIGSTTRRSIDSGNSLTSLSCPSASQCTAVDSGLREVTFDPTSGSASVVALDPLWNVQPSLPSVACPSTTQCTAVDVAGREITFNPTSVGSPAAVQLDSRSFNVVACPTATECTAADAVGREVTFNPTAPGKPRSDSIAAAPQLPVVLSVARGGDGSGAVTSSPAGIDCGVNCAASFPNATPVTLTATAAIGSRFSGWSGGGCSGTGPCHVTVTTATTVKATFSLMPPVTLKVSKSGGALGTVSSRPSGVRCGSTCSHAYRYGTSVTLTATAVAGAVFIRWSGACTGSSLTCSVSMTAARATTAAFARTKLLTVVKAGTGSGRVTSSPAGISCRTTCKHGFAPGTVVTLTATAKSGSRFTGWSGACRGAGNCVVTMSVARRVTAAFN